MRPHQQSKKRQRRDRSRRTRRQDRKLVALFKPKVLISLSLDIPAEDRMTLAGIEFLALTIHTLFPAKNATTPRK